jgi:hypothetical protein
MILLRQQIALLSRHELRRRPAFPLSLLTAPVSTPSPITKLRILSMEFQHRNLPRVPSAVKFAPQRQNAGVQLRTPLQQAVLAADDDFDRQSAVNIVGIGGEHGRRGGVPANHAADRDPTTNPGFAPNQAVAISVKS